MGRRWMRTRLGGYCWSWRQTYVPSLTLRCVPPVHVAGGGVRLRVRMDVCMCCMCVQENNTTT